MRTVPLTHQRVTIQDDFDLDKILESGQCFRPQKRSDGRPGGVFCLLAFGGSFLAYRLPLWIWAVGAAIFWGVLPILTQVIVNIKKTEK